MATIERLKRRPDFLATAEGRRFHTERMTAQGRLRDPQAAEGLRLGFTITKRVGHAVERNRIRRRLRAAVSLVASDLPSELAGLPADIVLIARRPALTAPFEVLAEDLRRALPTVTRPAAPRPPGQRSGGKAGAKSGGRSSKSTPLQRDAGYNPAQPAASGAVDRDPPRDAVRGPRITEARQSDGAGAAPVATPNACGGVPDGQ
ncbi:ribonuclease P protein component [Methylobacterium pseudosasicola]|uniref:Ribonuclease P protein component n=1 Tax=Methylobacterium pseudosasicola TaxID=582667 RepID=A0A1I4TA16_9HYPH|nr:ribonuclease P protein component [Methylobacterium pseudosasicola]SFM73526.1 ribonuclease P protein component [Methylobacterium pseudosasicola]